MLAIGVVFTVLAIGWSVTLSAAVQLLAATVTVLTMGGTQHPLVDAQGGWADPYPFVEDYAADAIRVYVAPSAIGGSSDPADYQAVAVHTPEEFAPVFGTTTFNDSLDAGAANLDRCIQGDPCVARDVPGVPDTVTPPVELEGPFVVYGYSQSAVIATMEKRKLIEQHGDSPDAPDVTFVLLANPNRPNGGIMQRFEGLHIPMLDVTFNGSTPTDSQFTTVDIARQYDGWVDFPAYPMNMAATANALLGIYYLHGDYWGEGVGPALYQGTTGDTTYYMIPTDRLPLLMPFEQLGVPSPILTALDAPLRVIVEWGYDRNPDSVGTPTRAGLFPLVNPITGVVNLVVAIPTGLDDGLAEAADDPNFRPLGTTAPTSPFGVGGEELGAPLPAPEPAATGEPALLAAATPAVDKSARLDVRREDATLADDNGDDGDEVKPQRRGPLSRILDRLKPQRHQPVEDTDTSTTDPGGESGPTTGENDPEPAPESDPNAA
jgi:hypothetical protein